MMHVLVTLSNKKWTEVSNAIGYDIRAIAEYIALFWLCNLLQVEMVDFEHLSV